VQKRRRFRQTDSLEARLAEEAQRLRAEAAKLPHGAEREELIRKARRTEASVHMSEWLTSPGLRAPTQYSDAERAKRFRDKAAEAMQLIDLAETESRRSALQQIADSYNRVADQLEGIVNANRALR
jgi:hypothetical protein